MYQSSSLYRTPITTTLHNQTVSGSIQTEWCFFLPFLLCVSLWAISIKLVFEGIPWCQWLRSTFQCRGRRVDPWLETKIPRALGQLSLRVAAREAHMPQWRSGAAKKLKQENKVLPSQKKCFGFEFIDLFYCIRDVVKLPDTGSFLIHLNFRATDFQLCIWLCIPAFSHQPIWPLKAR